MLIIPAMHIVEGRCSRLPDGRPGTEHAYPDDPALMARVWRGENAKALHVSAAESEDAERVLDCLRRICAAVDIPVQFEAAGRDEHFIATLLEEVGLYRCMLDAQTSMHEMEAELLLARFGPRKVVASVRCPAVTASVGEQDALLRSAQQLIKHGFQRVVLDLRAWTEGPPESFLHSLCERTMLSVTLFGGVRHYHDLKLVQSLHPRKIDSIILDEAVYSNAFPCQAIWRLAEERMISRNTFP
ncbi:MAG TPA: HisA/HisF-related TIM barrel protein [Bacteroidota bacterium]|nr:HisA/HisF-related TIM barrel protein [Bacteroidota bacterium]